MRLASLLRERGFESVEIEKGYAYTLPTLKDSIRIRYRIDITGTKGTRTIAIEIDGYMGHKSKRAFEMDGLRSRRIQEAYGPIDIYRFTFGQLAHWSDEEIAQEMNLQSK